MEVYYDTSRVYLMNNNLAYTGDGVPYKTFTRTPMILTAKQESAKGYGIFWIDILNKAYLYNLTTGDLECVTPYFYFYGSRVNRTGCYPCGTIKNDQFYPHDGEAYSKFRSYLDKLPYGAQPGLYIPELQS